MIIRTKEIEDLRDMEFVRFMKKFRINVWKVLKEDMELKRPRSLGWWDVNEPPYIHIWHAKLIEGIPVFFTNYNDGWEREEQIDLEKIFWEKEIRIAKKLCDKYNGSLVVLSKKEKNGRRYGLIIKTENDYIEVVSRLGGEG